MRRAGRVNASEAIPCPAVSPPAHPQCLLSTFGSDGAGRRIEASLSCVAAAHDLGVQYVHMPFLKLEHHTSAGHANRFLGMDFLAERCRWPTVRATKAESNCGKCPPAAVVPSTFKLVPFKSDLVGKEDCAAGRASADWLGDLLQDPARCAQDGGSLHVGYHCFGYFWCTVRARGHSAFCNRMPPSLFLLPHLLGIPIVYCACYYVSTTLCLLFAHLCPPPLCAPRLPGYL
jgi:hypothetical protein